MKARPEEENLVFQVFLMHNHHGRKTLQVYLPTSVIRNKDQYTIALWELLLGVREFSLCIQTLQLPERLGLEGKASLEKLSGVEYWQNLTGFTRSGCVPTETYSSPPRLRTASFFLLSVLTLFRWSDFKLMPPISLISI